MKNILIDIKHPAQLNLFKNVSSKLKKQDWNVLICYLDRGKLPKIIQKEYLGFTCIKVGSSKGSKWSIIWEGNLKRTNSFVRLIQNQKIDICISASSAPLALACKLTNTPILQFYDDPERGAINKINEILSTKLFFPPIINKNNKIEVFNCLKEWSYLSPNYFKPDPSVLRKYGLKAKEFVFVREVSNKSFNYYDQMDAIICRFSQQLPDNITYILSLEDKSLISQFPSSWKILEEPVDDIHSLIYYSKLVISSGDSMAREGAMLGVRSIYCGTREMKANKLLIELGLLQHHPGEEAIKPIITHSQAFVESDLQINIQSELLVKWDDLNEFMEDKIKQYVKK
jgi:predicted glycosyltransferase